MPTYNTLAQLTSLEIPKIQGSRFIATAFPAREESEVVEQRLRLAKLYPTANHHCWAWRGEDPQKFRCSDDGEPYGSAGIPILKAIEGRELSATAVIVTRIFGGTKLGVGGLVRAYTAASCNVLDLSPRVEQVLTVAVTLDYGYPHTPQVEAMLHRFAAVTTHADYGEKVNRVIAVEPEKLDEFCSELSEACAGDISIAREKK